VPPGRHAKTSLYIGCCKNAREAAVAHDLAVVWWRVGTDYAPLWQQHEAAAAGTPAEHQQRQPGGQLEPQQQDQQQEQQQEQEQQREQQPMEIEGEEQLLLGLKSEQQQQQPHNAAGDGGGGDGGDGATLPPHLLPEVVELQPDTSILKQLNFPPAM
jgi:hypothetical protein